MSHGHAIECHGGNEMTNPIVPDAQGVTFLVDDVKPARTPLPQGRMHELLRDRVSGTLESCLPSRLISSLPPTRGAALLAAQESGSTWPGHAENLGSVRAGGRLEMSLLGRQDILTDPRTRRAVSAPVPVSR